MEKELDTILREVLNLVENLHTSRRVRGDAYDTVCSAVQKYDTDIKEFIFHGEPEGTDCEKIIWQIIMDLRFAKDTDLDYDGQFYDEDCLYLDVITDHLIKNTKVFNVKDYNVINITPLKRDEYLAIIEGMGLK